MLTSSHFYWGLRIIGNNFIRTLDTDRKRSTRLSHLAGITNFDSKFWQGLMKRSYYLISQ